MSAVPATLTFDADQGIWHITCGDEGFWSTGLDRALAHTQAVFGTAPEDAVITVDPEIDELTRAARTGSADQANAAIAAAVSSVHTREVPLGVHDLCVLFRCEPSVLHELFAALNEPAD